MTNKITLQSYIVKAIKSLNSEIVTAYQLSVILHNAYILNTNKKINLNRLKHQIAGSGQLDKLIKELLSGGFIFKSNYFSSNVYSLTGTIESPAAIMCSIDPFCYLSHLSAAEFHGITDVLSKRIYLTTYMPTEWRKNADEKMKNEILDIEQYKLKKLNRTVPTKNKIGKQEILTMKVKKRGTFKNIDNGKIRVAGIGQTFLDILREPDLCGGIYHVIEIFKEHAELYVDQIFSTINSKGKNVDKVRAGYILEKICNIGNDRFNEWLKYSQRGGSRKLYAKAPYSHNFSEKWCLSINVDY